MRIEHLVKDCITETLREDSLGYMELYNKVAQQKPGLRVNYFRTMLAKLQRNNLIEYDKITAKFVAK